MNRITETLLPIGEVRKALKTVKGEAYQLGFQAGKAEAERFLRYAVSLNGSGPRVLKALEVDQPAVDDSPLEALTLAYIDLLAEAKTENPDGDGGEAAKYLENLFDDPDALTDVLSQLDGEPAQLEKSIRLLLKSFDESKHPRADDGRFIGREAIHEAKSDPAKAESLREKTTDPDERKKLDAALAGESDLGRTKAGLHREKVAAGKAEKQSHIEAARSLANDISTARRGGEAVDASHFVELASHLPHLTVQELRSVRIKLAASFAGSTRRDDMVSALTRHAKNQTERLNAEAKYEHADPLDFSLDTMSDVGSFNAHGPHGNPNSPESHGGRMEQRGQVQRAHGEARVDVGSPRSAIAGYEPAPVGEPVPAKEVLPDVPPRYMPAAAHETKEPKAALDAKPAPVENGGMQQPPAPGTPTSSPEFKTWFAGSKVVDGGGNPLPVYHGTTADFDAFRKTGIGEFGPAIYFTSDHSEASSYGNDRGMKGDFRLVTAHLNLKNPYVIKSHEDPTKFFKDFKAENDEAAIQKAKDNGFDGIAYERPKYSVNGKTYKGVVHYIAFDPEQVAISDKGTSKLQTKSLAHSDPYAPPDGLSSR